MYEYVKCYINYATYVFFLLCNKNYNLLYNNKYISYIQKK